MSKLEATRNLGLSSPICAELSPSLLSDFSKRRGRFFLGLILLTLLGWRCAGPPALPPGSLERWLEQQQFSVWKVTRFPPPRHPDGFTSGNREIFFAVGTDQSDLSALTYLYGDRKQVRALTPPKVARIAVTFSGKRVAVAELADQRLERIRHTGVMVGTARGGGLDLRWVDSAPIAPELNAVQRMVLVRNTGRTAIRGLRVHLSFKGPWDFQDAGRGIISLGGRQLTVYSEQPLQAAAGNSPVQAEQATPRRQGEGLFLSTWLEMGSLKPGQGKAGVFYLMPASGDQAFNRSLKAIQQYASRPLQLLQGTCQNWSRWARSPETFCSDRRLADLLDSLLCLTRSHVGYTAIHTGSLRYPHTRAWTRDNYWVQRALLEAGRKQEALLNLASFYRFWQKSGVESYYQISSGKGATYGYGRVELPHYLVLMVRDAERWAGEDGRKYYLMVKDCLEQAELSPEGLQPMNGDETWLLACWADELAYQLDNSWLLVASAQYGAELARRMGDRASAARFQAMAGRARAGLKLFEYGERFACQRHPDGLIEPSLISGVLARALVLGVLPADDPRVTRSLQDCWQSLNYAEGIRADARTRVLDGGTPGYFLWAAAQAGQPFAGELAGRLMDFCAAPGNVWELASLDDPSWGLEKRRLWDSAVVLMGLWRYLYGLRPVNGGLEINPHPPAGGWVELRNYPWGKHQVSLRADQRQVTVRLDGKQVVEAAWPAKILIRGNGQAKVIAIPAAPPIPPIGALEGKMESFLASNPSLVASPGSGHADLLEVEMLRQKERMLRRAASPPARGSYLMVSSQPPALVGRVMKAVVRSFVKGIVSGISLGTGTTRVEGGKVSWGGTAYWPVPGGGRVWMSDRGDAWRDTLGMVDLIVNHTAPARRPPMAYPNAAEVWARRFGRSPAKPMPVRVEAAIPMTLIVGDRTAAGRTAALMLAAGKSVAARPAPPWAAVTAENQGHKFTLVVSARSRRPARVRVEVNLPAGCLVLNSRGNSGWDRLADPVEQRHLPDGTSRLIFELGAQPEPKGIRLELTVVSGMR